MPIMAAGYKLYDRYILIRLSSWHWQADPSIGRAVDNTSSLTPTEINANHSGTSGTDGRGSKSFSCELYGL